ncbi:hypothetical protein [Weizmannia acidilactici]|uniref:hypothetical protein n=1 Tax=Weizmannia acidilactici TaxID=2607726 RepID=UPI00124E0CE8|nr:hypothetical protein [Weizmannia acidilactici]GER74679.1 hypothetical protein BpPP18_27460 [Weizmannia acidilactici]
MEKIAYGIDQKQLKKQLDLIAQIVHQGDYPADRLEKAGISLRDALDVIDFIEKLVNAIHTEIQKYLEVELHKV